MLGRAARWETPIHALLDGAHLNLSEVERLGGVSAMTISRWRRGIGTPQRSACMRLARVLGEDVDTVTQAVASTIAAAHARHAACAYDVNLSFGEIDA